MIIVIATECFIKKENFVIVRRNAEEIFLAQNPLKISILIIQLYGDLISMRLSTDDVTLPLIRDNLSITENCTCMQLKSVKQLPFVKTMPNCIKIVDLKVSKVNKPHHTFPHRHANLQINYTRRRPPCSSLRRAENLCESRIATIAASEHFPLKLRRSIS